MVEQVYELACVHRWHAGINLFFGLWQQSFLISSFFFFLSGFSCHVLLPTLSSYACNLGSQPHSGLGVLWGIKAADSQGWCYLPYVLSTETKAALSCCSMGTGAQGQ